MDYNSIDYDNILNDHNPFLIVKILRFLVLKLNLFFMNIQNIFEIFIVATNNANNNKNFRHGEYYILKKEKQSIQVFENKKILLRFFKNNLENIYE